MTCNRTRSKGFTLIELLVVVSIIALLISILLPAVGSARREARVSIDAQSMKEHGNGVAIYASANSDTLPAPPNAPISGIDDNGNQISNYGRAGRLAYTMGDADFPVGGWKFANPFVSIFGAGGSGWIYDDGRFGRLSMWDSYWMVMQPFMLEGEGPAGLNEILYSAADTEGLRDRAQIIEKYNEGLITAGTAGQNSWIPDVNPFDNDSPDPEAGPSFRYVPAAVNDTKIYLSTRAGQPVLGATPLAPQFDYLQGGENNFYAGARRNPVGTVKFPSQKALFFMEQPFHNPELDAWFEPSARTPVAMADGSARVADVYNEGLRWDPIENSGSYLWISPGEGPNEGILFDAHLLLNYGGLWGRDLQGQ